MPLYAELQIGKELIIYPMPVPRGKEHYKVNRMLEGSTVSVNGIAPLHLFNGELLYAKETGRIQRVEFNVKPNDTAAKEQAERTMNQLVEAMRKEVSPNPHALPAPDIIRSIQDPRLNDPEFDETGLEICKHRRTDYFIGTGIVCRDCKKKLRV